MNEIISRIIGLALSIAHPDGEEPFSLGEFREIRVDGTVWKAKLERAPWEEIILDPEVARRLMESDQLDLRFDSTKAVRCAKWRTDAGPVFTFIPSHS